jgi:hypothetical protein
MRYFTAIAVLLFGFSAQAAPVTWTLEGVVFDDGGTAFGSFIYDADFNVYSSVNITTTAGTDLAGDTYQYPNGVFTNPLSLVATSQDVPNLTNVPAIGLFFSDGLTNSGGALSLIGGPSRETLCEDVECNAGLGEPFSRDRFYRPAPFLYHPTALTHRVQLFSPVKSVFQARLSRGASSAFQAYGCIGKLSDYSYGVQNPCSQMVRRVIWTEACPSIPP